MGVRESEREIEREREREKERGRARGIAETKQLWKMKELNNAKTMSI